jgi:Membrane domain of glycerophosphoryl diester phosphodiesterase
MPFELRPLTLGELLDRSFSLYRRHFWLFVGIMALPSLLALAFGVLVAASTPQAGGESLGAEPRTAQDVGAAIWFALAMMGMAIVYFITYAVALGATTSAVSLIYAERLVSIRGAYAALRGKVGRLAVLLLLVSIRIFGVLFGGLFLIGVVGALATVASPIIGGLLLFGGMLLVFVLCGWMALRYAVAVPVAVLEDETPTESIRRSIALTQGSLGRVFALLVFTMIITYAVLAIFQGPFMAIGFTAGPETPTFFWANMLGTISGAIGGAFTAPLMIVAFAVLYYDLRVRKEGLDLELMLANLDRAGGKDPAVSSALLPS